jgi:hypothetical protein
VILDRDVDASVKIWVNGYLQFDADRYFREDFTEYFNGMAIPIIGGRSEQIPVKMQITDKATGCVWDYQNLYITVKVTNVSPPSPDDPYEYCDETEWRPTGRKINCKQNTYQPSIHKTNPSSDHDGWGGGAYLRYPASWGSVILQAPYPTKNNGCITTFQAGPFASCPAVIGLAPCDGIFQITWS